MLFAVSTTQPQETGNLGVAAALFSGILEANPVPLAQPIRFEFLAVGIAGQTGTVVLELNHVTLATFAVGDGEKVAVWLTLRRTSDNQATLRGIVTTDDAVAALPSVPINDLAWTRNQLLRVVGTSDQDNGLTLRDFALEK